MSGHIVSNHAELSKYFYFDFQIDINQFAACLLASLALYVDSYSLSKSYSQQVIYSHEMSQALNNYFQCIPSCKDRFLGLYQENQIRTLSDLIEKPLIKFKKNYSVYASKILVSIGNLFGVLFKVISETSLKCYGTTSVQPLDIYLYKDKTSYFTLFPNNYYGLTDDFLNFIQFSIQQFSSCGHQLVYYNKTIDKCGICSKSMYQFEKAGKGKAADPPKTCPDCKNNFFVKCHKCLTKFCIKHDPKDFCLNCGSDLHPDSKNKNILKDNTFSPPDIIYYQPEQLQIPDALTPYNHNDTSPSFLMFFHQTSEKTIKSYSHMIINDRSIIKISKTFLSYPSIKEIIIQDRKPIKNISIVRYIQSLLKNNQKVELAPLVELVTKEISKPSLYQSSQPDYIKMLRLTFLFSARITILGDTKITFGPEFKHSKLWAGFISDSKSQIIIRIKNPKYKDAKANFDQKQENFNTLVTCKIKNYRESLKTKEKEFLNLICGCKEKTENFINRGCLYLQDYNCTRHGASLSTIEIQMVERSFYNDKKKCGKCGSIIGEFIKCTKCKLLFCASECAHIKKYQFVINEKKIKCPRCKNKINAIEENCSMDIQNLGINNYEHLTKNSNSDLLYSSINNKSCKKCKLFKVYTNNLCKSCSTLEI